MRRLILMRHAKSSWAEADQRDLDRPLTKRGRRSAALLGGWLKAKHWRPDHALVSSARRTQETWAGVVSVAGAAPTSYLPELYHAAPEALLDILHRGPDVACVLMLGHEPGIGGFATRLLPDPPADPDFVKFPTCATAVIDLPVTRWTEAAWDTGRLAAFTTPRSLE